MNNIFECQNCKINQQNILYHVDHNKPSFLELRENFLSNRNDIPTKLNNCPLTNICTFKEEDSQFKNDWINYHLENANLQILCNQCNLRKPKKEFIDLSDLRCSESELFKNSTI